MWIILQPSIEIGCAIKKSEKNCQSNSVKISRYYIMDNVLQYYCYKLVQGFRITFF